MVARFIESGFLNQTKDLIELCPVVMLKEQGFGLTVCNTSTTKFEIFWPFSSFLL